MTQEQLDEALSTKRKIEEYERMVDKITDLETTQNAATPSANFSIQGTEYSFRAVDVKEKEMFYGFLSELKSYYSKKLKETQKKFDKI